MSGKPRSKEDTWGEKDLSRHILKDQKRRGVDTYGSPKSSPKTGRSGQGKSQTQSSTAPKGKAVAAAAVRGKQEDKASTASPLSSRKGGGGGRGGGGGGGGRGGGDGKKEDRSQRQRDKVAAGSSSSRGGEKVISSEHKGQGRGVRREGGQERGGQRKGEGGGGGRRDGARDVRRAGETEKREQERRGERRGGEGRGGGGRAGGEKGGGRDSKRQEKERASKETRSQGKRGEEKGGRDKKLDSASGVSLREKEPGAPIADAVEEMERQLREKQRTKRGGEGVETQLPDGTGPTLQPMVEVREDWEEEEEVEEDYEYEEEFEEDDYDEEFEEDIEEEDSAESQTESEGVEPATPPHPPVSAEPSFTPQLNLVEIMQAIDAENRQVGEGEKSHDQPGSAPQPPLGLQLEPTPVTVGVSASQASQWSQGSQGSQRRGFVDFSTAKKKEDSERVAKKARRRGQELLSLIELDVVAISLFDLQPLSEYEIYMRSFGGEGARQVACQTGEDSTETDMQTEDIATVEKWVQWPPEDSKGFGGPMSEDAEQDEVVTMATSSVRLTSFLKRASQVIGVLLEENAVSSGQSPSRSTQSPFPFCSSCMSIHPPSLLEGCTLTYAEFSTSHTNLLMTAYSTRDHPLPSSPELRGGGVVCVWSTQEPSQPHYVLVCESSPVCGCFSPHRSPVVFSGNEDGSIVLWDLREPVAMHTMPPGTTPTTAGPVPRSPTFSTAALSHKHNHHSPIVTLSPISTDTPHTHTTSPLTGSTDNETIGLSYQLASLDRSGLLIIWVVVETSPDPDGSEYDLGLMPGGRVKLVWSTAVELGRPSLVPVPAQTHCLRFHPTDTNHIFVGTDEGSILHHTRYGRRPIPSQYQPQTDHHGTCDVTSLSFSPWQPDYFLAGYSNGSVALYHTKRAHPLVIWSQSTNGIAVQQVEWVEHQPGVFVVLDSDSRLYHWDLMKNDAGPTHSHKMKTSVSFIRLSPSHPTPPQSSHHTPSLLLPLSNGSLEPHLFRQPLASSEDQQQLLCDYLQSLH